MTYYSQRDPRWAEVIYSAKQPHTETIKSSGCGIACAASVISSLTDEIVEPPEMAEFSVQNGYRIDGVGTANALFPAVCEKYGLAFSETHSVAQAIQCVEEGGLVVCGTTGKPRGIFSTGGHFFLLTGHEGELLQFFDPDRYENKYRSYGRQKYALVKGEFVYVRKEYADPEINQYYCIKREDLTVKEYEELSARIAKLEEPEMIYHYVDENMPEWARSTVQKLMDREYLKGTDEGLGLDDSMLRILVILDRAGVFEK